MPGGASGSKCQWAGADTVTAGSKLPLACQWASGLPPGAPCVCVWGWACGPRASIGFHATCNRKKSHSDVEDSTIFGERRRFSGHPAPGSLHPSTSVICSSLLGFCSDCDLGEVVVELTASDLVQDAIQSVGAFQSGCSVRKSSR